MDNFEIDPDEVSSHEFMTDYLDSIIIAGPVGDWRKSDTWGDPEDEMDFIPEEYREYVSNPDQVVHKSKTKYTEKKKFNGLTVCVENLAGSTRSGVSKEGKDWSTNMKNDYGYISRTEGEDGEHVDVYLGPNEDAEYVYVIHQAKPETGKYDEDKCMVGFDESDKAVKAYLTHYDSPKFFGAVTAVPFSMFKEKVFKNKGEPIVPDAAEKVEKNKSINKSQSDYESEVRNWQDRQREYENLLSEAVTDYNILEIHKAESSLNLINSIYKSKLLL